MLNFKEIEKEVLEFWEKNKIYDKVKKKNEKGKKFYFLQGPPYTSGRIHIGHAWNNSLKDMALRYRRMNGFNVWDRAGYDMHGLPTENKVQKELGLKNKDEIVKYGVDKFVNKCKEFSIKYAKIMDKDLWNLGVWLDYKNAYYPITREWISGEWAFFKNAWKQNRIYRGKRVMHWDAETETSLSKHELEYKTIRDTSVFLKFKKKNADEYFVVWTTTPWTIPFNLAVMVNPEIDYVKINVGGEKWIVAKKLVESFVSGILDKKYKILEEFKGKDLEGQEYENPFYDDLKEEYDKLKIKWENVHTIILSKEYVDTNTGTGLVHCAPGCGPEDYEVGKKYGIGAFNVLNGRGEFENLGKFNGWRAKIDDKKFIDEFDKKGILIAKTKIEHEYPHSDRTHKPVIFRATEQWFLKTKNMVDKLLDFDKNVNWVPKKSGENYERWAENLRDNSVGRQRFWGCPVPIWVNEDNKDDFFVVGSVEELEEISGIKNIEPHKPWVDEIVVEKDGNKYRRILDVADVWIDSGTASWNCLYNNPNLIKKWFPADFVLEGTEQTRLWFSLLQICSAIQLNKSCYKNVFTHGMIFSIGKVKMSKSLGNIISPYEVIDKFSVDVLRYYICQINAGENISFNWNDIKVKQRNMIILSNIANYILDLESQNPKNGKKDLEEKWILSKYHSTLKKVTELFEEYRLDETIGKIEDLFITLSKDYIKFVRNKSGKNRAVLETIKEVYIGILKMFSTICPFISESLWMKISQNGESIHLCDWPKYDPKKIDETLEEDFKLAMQIIEKGLAIRDREKTGLRWPLSKAKIYGKKEFSADLLKIIAGQLNVKKVEFMGGKELKVTLDMKITPELEAEGFVREISRRVQAERKKRGLKKEDRIELNIFTGNYLKEIKNFEKMLRERTGAKKINFVEGKNNKLINFEIKEKNFRIGF